MHAYINKYKYARYRFFKWKYELPFAHKVCLSLLMACLTGMGAQMRLYLPFTPVPITGQVFFVLLSGILLGRWFGGLSQGFYVGIGAIGIPWFAGWRGGISVLMGVTGGYIIGFIVVAFLIGHLTEQYIKARTLVALLPLLIGGVCLIYLLGALQFSIIMGTGLQETFMLAVLPFIPLDLGKAVGVALVGKAIIPKEAYNGERDRKRWEVRE